MKHLFQHTRLKNWVKSFWNALSSPFAQCSMFNAQCSIVLLLLLSSLQASAQQVTLQDSLTAMLNEYFTRYQADEIKLVGVKTDSLLIDYPKRQIAIYSSRLGTQPLRQHNVKALYDSVNALIPEPLRTFKTKIYAGPYPIDSLIPNYYNENRIKDRLYTDLVYQGKPWVRNASRPYQARFGLENKHLSIAQSHGKYWDNKKEWRWQRPRLFTTTEDLFTQSIVLPYLIPMLQNAGAIVFTPRERDTQTHEVVVDNDGNLSGSGLTSTYQETTEGLIKWSRASFPGFAQRQRIYTTQNPFQQGTARYIETDRHGNATAEWIPDIPEEGEYAVYVSYQTMPTSIDHAHYQVIHSGIVTEFEVNQQMGGSTWVYLGTFRFEKGKNEDNKVVLSNKSNEKGVVTADAVRFGGGMGNINRDGHLSELPRYLEGSRYWGQWAGMPDSVYTEKERKNDYTDDINSRSWIQNYLSGGSIFNPDQVGARVPIELSLAVHSDAGFNRQDTIIGTLAIATTEFNDGLLGSGRSRLASRDLADMVQTQLVSDLRARFIPTWNRRYIWDRNYSETRVPQTISAIIETMSHQNFGDLIYGHDPNIKFTMARALYKGILRFLSNQRGEHFVVQPLPVDHFAIRFGERDNTLLLTWQPTDDPLEPDAIANRYIVYTRIGEGDFDNGVIVEDPRFTIEIKPDMIYSFKVAALNDGGESFPSEVLSAMKSSQEQHRVLIINGFNRLSGPAQVNTASEGGFDLRQDPGVAYHYNISLGGIQQNFDRKARGENWGVSNSELEGHRYAGNSFDYPYIHGKAIKSAVTYSFTSCSARAFEDQLMGPGGYEVIDLILGLEKADPKTFPLNGVPYKTFRTKMRQILTAYMTGGGNVLVSGAYIGSDMQSAEEHEFTRTMLKYTYPLSVRTDAPEHGIKGMGRTISIPAWLNEMQYPVVSVDVIEAVDPAFAAMTYTANNFSAAVAYGGSDYRTFSMGFPFESITKESERASIMAGILQFLVGSR